MASDPLFLPGQRLPAGDLNLLSPDPIAWTPNWVNVTLGTGATNNGWWWRIGREINWCVDLTLGTGGDVSGVIEMDYDAGMPEPEATMVAAFVCAVWANITTSTRYAGTAIGDADGITRFVSNGTATGWNASQPGDWQASSALRAQGKYIAAE